MKKAIPTNFHSALVMWEDGEEERDGRFGAPVNVAHETTLNRICDDVFGIQYHMTTVVEIYKRAFILDSGGFRTKTTKARMNATLGDAYCVYARKGQWYVEDRNTGEAVPFEDGMIVKR